MDADKLKRMEERGRSAFMQGDLNSATKYFLQALEKQSHPLTHEKLTRERPLSKSLQNLNNNHCEQLLIVHQDNTFEKHNKKSEKRNGKKKKDVKESGVETLNGVVCDANAAIKKFPSYPMGYLRKASALIVLNEWEEARITYLAGLERCKECALLKSALFNLNKIEKITSCAATLDMVELSVLLNNKSSPPNNINNIQYNHTIVRRNRFRLQGQRKFIKKTFSRASDDLGSICQIQGTSFRRRNSSSTDTHL
ncbi:uncharacterized protein LOC124442793 isoform X2 [Xenia sp. Carnegie-2017]|uniref:uncharacterized protein LOC124442793 isoform X2 n=1 Tax=Xenia sp. Carnegie-2017 TaxID=2897299 RepID=UPI001F037371|nr:uncharacterized protein LOC124442793 isoform X2 [Xenia sp. Carnegie-2017]